MNWTTKGYHKIILDDLKHLAQEIGSFSEEQDLSDQRFRFQEISRFAHKIQLNASLAINLIHQLEQER